MIRLDLYAGYFCIKVRFFVRPLLRHELVSGFSPRLSHLPRGDRPKRAGRDAMRGRKRAWLRKPVIDRPFRYLRRWSPEPPN
jgi:hypothetical protein